MKFKTTQRNIKANYKHVVSVGYCNLQNLLNRKNPIAYTTRREGWGADVYDCGSIAIATGYAPFGDIRPSYDLCQKYDQAAAKIMGSAQSWESGCATLGKLLDKFIAEAVKEEA